MVLTISWSANCRSFCKIQRGGLKFAEKSSTGRISQQLAWRLAIDNSNSSSGFWSEARRGLRILE